MTHDQDTKQFPEKSFLGEIDYTSIILHAGWNGSQILEKIRKTRRGNQCGNGSIRWAGERDAQTRYLPVHAYQMHQSLEDPTCPGVEVTSFEPDTYYHYSPCSNVSQHLSRNKITFF